jgi:pSer/pThr/pTyr-binding forkhead associated (FHA) protein
MAGTVSSIPPPNVHAAGPAGERRCKICDTVNGPNLRYCTSCGSTLDAVAGPAPAPAPAAAAVVARTPAPAPAAIAPGRVVDLAPSAAPAEAGRVCSRCRGTADPAAQFCKFCGNPLGEGNARSNGQAAQPVQAPAVAAPAAPAPSPSPIGPAAAAAAAAPARVSNYGGPPQPSGAAALAAIPSAQPAQRSSAPAPAPAASRAVAAAPAQRGRLVVIAKSGADGPSYPFGDLLDIGRIEGNVIVGEDPYLSPRHVRISWQNGKLFLRDLQSTNGVYLRLAPSRDTTPRRSSDNPEVAVPLVDHDFILVGQQVLRFDILKEGEAGLGPAQEHGTLLFGSPAAPRYARLCQRTVEGIARDIYYIRKVETVLGRESGDVVFTEDPFLSRRHVAIRLLSRDGAAAQAPQVASRPPAEPRFALVDLGSSNGTFLKIKGDVELFPGDHFRVGQQLFRVDFESLGVRG